MTENDEWTGMYFRLPKALKEDFIEAVAKTYGVEKGNIGQCLRDLIKDFVDYVNMSTTAPDARLRAIEKIVDARLANESYAMDFTTFEKGAWKTYEDLLSVMWLKWGRYPEEITKKDFYAFLGMVRGKSRTTKTRWKKELIKAGLISERPRTIRINYPLIYDVIDFYSIPEEVFNHFHFALISPDADVVILTYRVPIKMNPDHVAVISIRIEPKQFTLFNKAFVPKTEYARFIENMEHKTPYTGNVPLFKVLNAMLRKDNYKPIDATMSPQLAKFLRERFNAPTLKLLPLAELTKGDIDVIVSLQKQ